MEKGGKTSFFRKEVAEQGGMARRKSVIVNDGKTLVPGWDQGSFF